jgi:hypothetical protein
MFFSIAPFQADMGCDRGHFGQKLNVLITSDWQRTCIAFRLFLELYNVEVETGRSEKRQKSDDFISTRMHARPKAVSSNDLFENRCMGCVAGKVSLYGSKAEREVTAHGPFHFPFETN